MKVQDSTVRLESLRREEKELVKETKELLMRVVKTRSLGVCRAKRRKYFLNEGKNQFSQME